jgi:transposase
VAREQHGPTGLVLDQASIHRAGRVQERRTEWAIKGLTRCFLPAYSPERNKIELLGHRCKPYGLTPADYTCDRTWQQRVAHVLARVGSEYTVTFG